MIKMLDLGWCIGRLRWAEGERAPSLKIVSPTGDGDPATSVYIPGRDHLMVLKKALDEMFEDEQVRLCRSIKKTRVYKGELTLDNR